MSTESSALPSGRPDRPSERNGGSITRPTRRVRRPQTDVLGAVAAMLALALAVGLLARWGPDWPAQQFRAWTVAENGLTAWTNSWYSGLALPGYSVLYPVVGGALGVVVTAVLVAVAAVAGAAGFAPTDSRVRRIGFLGSTVLVVTADLIIGQVPFLLGVAFGVWTLRAVRADAWWPVALLLAVATSLSSPLAALFLLMAGPAVACAVGVRRALPIAGAVVGPVVAALLGGAGGQFPFPTKSIWWTAAFVAATVVLTTRAQRPLQVFALTYAVVAVLDLAVANPVGGNLARLGQLVALPIAWIALPRLRMAGGLRRVPLVAGLAGAVLVGAAGLWPVYPAVTAAAKGATQPSRQAGFYDGLRHFLAGQDPTRGRLEAVFTRQHWEAYFVAKSFPIARGWEQQTDEVDNAVLYAPLSAAAYRRWLDENAVDLVALPRAPLDVHAGVYEGALLADPPAYLIPVWHDSNWQVWRVRHARPLADGPATVATLGTASVVLHFERAGTSTLRIHAGPLWSVTQGAACLASPVDGFLRVRARRPGPVTLRARVGTDALLHRGADRC